jgi:Lon-like protease
MLTFHLGWGSWLCACGEQMCSPTRRLSRPRRIALTLFTDLDPDPPARRRASGWVGWSLLLVALVGAVIVALLPAPYVIEQPGPVYDVLGDVTVNGDQVPMIQIPMEETFPTEGSLDMLTVRVLGSPDSLPNWLDVATAYLDPSRAIVPVEEIYPPGVTSEQSTEQGKVDMANSQKEAIAAALTYLGNEVPSTLSVAEVQAGGPSDGLLEVGDVIETVNGETFPDVTGLRAAIADNGVSQPAEVTVLRAGVSTTLRINPELSPGDNPAPILGIVVASDYDFPFTVTIQLENVGGPSAGMMFALGIVDKLTPGSLNGGEAVAGTGTISSTGEVGPIGGIRQKMWGAKSAGAHWFLAPSSNCDEVTGHIPAGLTVLSVTTLDDAMTALAAIRSDGSTAGLPTCPTK